jgi:photosystem II stability/assembly factor-like uncharacterized protein
MKTLFYSFLCLILTTQIVTGQWYLQQSGTTENLRSVYFVDQNTGWICGSNGTILKTSNGGLNWITQITNTTDNLKSIQFADQNDGWAYGDTSRLSTNNGGTTWSVSNISSNFVGQQFLSSGIGWVGWVVLQDIIFPEEIEIWRYYNGWLAPIYVYAGDCDALFFLDENNGWITSVGFENVLRTTDGGSNWAFSNTFLLGAPTFIRFTTPQIGWVSSNTLGNSNISKSTDGGVTWFSQFTGELNEFINSISFPTTTTGFAVGFNYIPQSQHEGFIMKTGNGGTDWEEQYIDNGKLNSVFFVNENQGWAVGDGGKILVTANGGTPVELLSFTASVLQNEKAVQLYWTTATETNNSGFEVERFQDYKIEKLQDWETIGFVPGFGTTTELKSYSFIDEDVTTGTYKYRLKQIDFDGTFNYSNEIEVEVDFTPKEFVLYQNYPNPFNPSTTIKYEIPSVTLRQAQSDIMVSLKVYDVLGNEVATLVNEEKQPGVYEVEFRPESGIKNPASGVYFYQIKAGSFIQTKKMTLAK